MNRRRNGLSLLLFLGAGLCVGLAPARSGATEARQLALGGMADYYEDDASVRRWSGSLFDYPDRAVAGLGGYLDADLNRSGQGTSASGGLHVALDAAGRLGVGAIYFHARAVDSASGTALAGDSGGSVAALYGRRIGRFQAGLFFRNVSHEEVEVRPDGRSASRGEFQSDYGLGLRADLTPDVYLDLAGEVRDVRVSYRVPELGLDLPRTGAAAGHGLRARFFWRVTERVAIIPRLAISRERRPLVRESTANLVNLDGRAWRAGIGLNFLRDPDNLLVFSCDYRYRVAETSDRDGALPIFGDSRETVSILNPRLALESRLSWWLTVRLAVQYIRAEHDPDDDPVRAAAPLTLGLALHLRSVFVDLALNSRAPYGLDEGLFATGEDPTAIFFAAAVGYDF